MLGHLVDRLDYSGQPRHSLTHGEGAIKANHFEVIGFDGTFAMRQAMPWLSTVIQPINQMAQHAVELLVEQVDCLDLQRDQFPADIIELPIKLYRGRTV